MNGEIAQMSGIVMSARKALRDSDEIDYVPDKYVLSIKFLFVRRGRIIKRAAESKSVHSWFDICRKQHIEDIGAVTYFSPKWEFDRENKGWNIIYEEHIWKDAPEGKPSFINKSEEFKQVLLDIEKLAIDIEFKYFADIFHREYEVLGDGSLIKDDNMPTYIPDEFRGIYHAVKNADVFGAMGSWNDSPPYYAKEKGLEKEYDELSNKLLEQLRYNLMYIVNECWI